MSDSHTVVRGLRPEQVERLRDACYDEAIPAPVRQRNELIVALLAETGRSAAELVALDADALDGELSDSLTRATRRSLRAYLAARPADAVPLLAAESGDRLTPDDIDDAVRELAVVADVRLREPDGGRDDPAVAAATAANSLEAPAGESVEAATAPLDRLSDPFFAVDAEWRFTYVNEPFRSRVGESAGSLLGESLWDAFPDAVGTRFEEQYRYAMAAQEPVAFEAYFPPSDARFAIRAYPSETGLSVHYVDRAEPTDRVRALTRQEQRLRAMVEASADAVMVKDTDGRYQYINDAGAAYLGRRRAEVLGRTDADLFGREVGERMWECEERVLETEERLAYEERLAIDDDPRMFETVREPYYGPNGDLAGIVGVRRDVTDRIEYERTLTALHNSSRELMRAESKADVCRVVVETASDVLDLSGVAVRLYDPDEDVLRPVASDRDAELTCPPISRPADAGNVAGRAFTTGEPIIIDDIPDSDLPGTPDLQSGLFVPLGEHGTITAGSAEKRKFDDRTVTLVGILAASAEVALDRAEREAQNREWGERAARQRDELETLAQINAVVQEVRSDLLQAATREELEQTVCDQLVSSEFYEAAWIAVPERSDQDTIARTMSGIDDDEVDRFAEEYEPSQLGFPNREVLESGEPRALRSIPDDESLPDGLRTVAEDLGFRSCLIVPLTHGHTVFGALGIVSSTADAFREREQFALETLGETIGFAINSVLQRQLLLTDSVVELEFRGADAEDFFIDLSARLECRCSLEGIAPGNEGKLLHYVTVTGVESDRVVATVEGSDYVEDYRLVEADEDRCLLEVNMYGSAPKVLVRAGARIRRAEADCGDARIVAEVSPDADIREVVDTLRSTYSGLELASRQTVDRPIQTAKEFREGLGDRLTEKQRAALRAAYFAGYYDWPRGSTAEEVADAIDISSATLHHHLRHSQRKLLDSLFETDSL